MTHQVCYPLLCLSTDRAGKTTDVWEVGVHVLSHCCSIGPAKKVKMREGYICLPISSVAAYVALFLDFVSHTES